MQRRELILICPLIYPNLYIAIRCILHLLRKTNQFFQLAWNTFQNCMMEQIESFFILLSHYLKRTVLNMDLQHFIFFCFQFCKKERPVKLFISVRILSTLIEFVHKCQILTENFQLVNLLMCLSRDVGLGFSSEYLVTSPFCFTYFLSTLCQLLFLLL